MQNKTPKEIKELQKYIRVEFLIPKDVGLRSWGREILIAHVPGLYTVKKLMYDKGAKGGLQAHQLKNECGYILSGKLLLRYDNGQGKIIEKVLGPGEAIHIPPCAVHQEEALEDLVIIEASNPIFNDRVRMESEYGLEIPEGRLSSTTVNEIEIK